MEAHISIQAETESVYLDQTKPGCYTAITTILEDKGCNIDEGIFIGCDRAANNTDRKGGVIQYLGEHLKRLLQWCVCMLHVNELPIRHLFLTIDGCTSWPSAYCGLIGK